MPPRTFSTPFACVGLLLALAGTICAADEQPLIVPAPAQIIRRAAVRIIANGAEESVEAGKAAPAKPDPAGPHLIEFSDGSRLHGTLGALDTATGQLTWQRADASATLAFPLTEIGHLKLRPDAKSETKAHATVKFTGGDWLAADVTGITDRKIQLKLGDGAPLTIDRDKVEWIYFSKTAAPECYDGPTSLADWTSAGGWQFREGALRAAMPTPIGRAFEVLPDQAEYFVEVNQGDAGHAFSLILHSDNVTSRGRGIGTLQFMFRGSDLRIWIQGENQMKSEQVDLGKLLPELKGNGGPDKKTVQFRVLEDFPGGKILVFINGRKAADWAVDPGKPGESRGSVIFQPQGWNPQSEQVISQFRVIPWDGRVPKDDASDEDAAKSDLVSLSGGEAKAGAIESLNDEHVKLRTEAGTVELPRAKITLLRFSRAAHPADEDPPVAHVQLAQRGEFDVTSLACRQGRCTLHTNFGGELALPLAALLGIDLARAPWSPPKPADELVFHNGDLLRGTLESAASGSRLRWRAPHAEAPLEFDTPGVAGIAFAAPAVAPEPKTSFVARLRNGDTLGGRLIKCDAENLVLDSAPAGQFAIARDQVQALYFAADGKLPVLDGAARRGAWVGVENNSNGSVQTNDKDKKKADPPRQPSAWRNFDGAYTYRPADTGHANTARTGSLRLAPDFDALPQLVELSFDFISSTPIVAFSTQLFFDDNNPGYLLQINQETLYIYDMGARQQFRANGQQQVQFGDKVKLQGRQRHLRVLADRTSGKLIVLVDGTVVTQIGPKAGSPPRNLGRGILLVGGQLSPCTFANLWVGPWNGQPPDLAPAPDAPPHTVLLANGDEAHGKVGDITAEAAKIDSEAGALELPTDRLQSIDFGGAPPALPGGIRVRFAEWGALTVKSFRVENDEIVCASTLAGEFKLPRTQVREIVFSEPTEKSEPEKKR